MLDLEALLQPATLEAPIGPDLEYSFEFTGWKRAALGKPERQVGSAIAPAEPPDWRDILEQGIPLLARSKDLRVAGLLVRALVEVHGYAGLAEGLTLLRGLVERYWDTLHPALDKEDGNDATARISALQSLTQRETLQSLRAAPLVVAKPFGAVSLRVLDAAGARAVGSKSPPSDAPTLAAIEAALEGVPLEALAEAHARLARSTKEVQSLADLIGSRVPRGAPDFAELRVLLRQAAQALRNPMDKRQPTDHRIEAIPVSASPTAAAVTFAGDVRSRDEVLRALDAICTYYGRSEPSSPVPLLLQRGRRLVTMSFVDILKEMLPESIANLQKIVGKTDA